MPNELALENEQAATDAHVKVFHDCMAHRGDYVLRAIIQGSMLVVTYQTQSKRVVEAVYLSDGQLLHKNYYEAYDFHQRLPKGFLFRNSGRK